MMTAFTALLEANLVNFEYFVLIILLKLVHSQAPQHLEQQATQNSITVVKKLVATKYIIISPQPVNKLLNLKILTVIIRFAYPVAVITFAIIVVNFVLRY